MADDQLSEEQARLEKARAFFAAEKKLLQEEKDLADKARAEKGGLEKREGETTGEWLARKDAEES